MRVAGWDTPYPHAFQPGVLPGQAARDARAAVAAGGGVSRHVFRLPDLGEGTVSAEIVEWALQPGDLVTEDQPLVENVHRQGSGRSAIAGVRSAGVDRGSAWAMPWPWARNSRCSIPTSRSRPGCRGRALPPPPRHRPQRRRQGFPPAFRPARFRVRRRQRQRQRQRQRRRQRAAAGSWRRPPRGGAPGSRHRPRRGARHRAGRAHPRGGFRRRHRHAVGHRNAGRHGRGARRARRRARRGRRHRDPGDRHPPRDSAAHVRGRAGRRRTSATSRKWT